MKWLQPNSLDYYQGAPGSYSAPEKQFHLIKMLLHCTQYDHTIIFANIKSLVEIEPIVLEKKRKSFNIVNYIYTILFFFTPYLKIKMNQIYEWMIYWNQMKLARRFFRGFLNALNVFLSWKGMSIECYSVSLRHMPVVIPIKRIKSLMIFHA